MLSLLSNANAFSIEDAGAGFIVRIGASRIDFVHATPSAEQALERLALVIEARIAFDRAQAMLAASENSPDELPPLWLVSGSNVLSDWLVWSSTDVALHHSLVLSDCPGTAPVTAYLHRRSRRELGHGAVRIRVNGGVAVAERIELVGRMPCNIVTGHQTRIRIKGHVLPETVINAVRAGHGRNALHPLSEVVDHPFIAAGDLRIRDARNDRDTVVIDIESRQVGLAPIPIEAMAVAPRDADPVCPWRPTTRELALLYKLVDEGRRHDLIG